jgi:uncharacterized delta-60 repeat protein
MKLKLRLLLIIPCCTSFVFSQVSLDPTFPTNGITYTDAMEFMSAIHIKSDGKILLTGHTGATADTDFVLSQFNDDGTPDTDFGSNGTVGYDSGNRDVSSGSIIQPDGKIIIVGSTYNYPAEPNRYSSLVMRVNEDGSLDTGFGTGGFAIHENPSGSEMATSVALDANDDLIIGLAQQNPSEIFRDGAVGKVSSSGSSFEILYEVPDTFLENRSGINDVKVQPDGKIVIAGYRTPEVFSDMALGRLNSDGSIDSDFGTDGYVYFSIDPENSVIEYSQAFTIHLYPDGRIMVTGDGMNYDAEVSRSILGRVNADGSRDTSFGNDGQVLVSYAGDYQYYLHGNTTLILPDGKIMIGGAKNQGDFEETGDKNFAFALRNENGSAYSGFGNNGNASISKTGDQRIMGLGWQSGKIVAVGYSDTANDDGYVLMRLAEIPLGVDPSSEIRMSVYPNPVSKALFIDPLPLDKNYTIVDLTGKIIARGILGVEGIAVDKLAQGVYFLKTGLQGAVRFIKE